MSRKVQKGNQTTLKFYFATRVLLAVEAEAFFAGLGLPAGVGFDPAKVLLETTLEGAGPVVTEAGNVRDGVGEYHHPLTPEVEGDLLWRGIAQDGGGNQIAATPYETIEVEGSKTGRVAAMVDVVLNEGSFDVTEARILKWLNEAHRKLISRSTVLRKRLEVGPSVAGQANYELPDEVVQIREVLVGGRAYGTGRHSDISVGSYLLIDGTGGVTAQDSTPGGAAQIALIPAPPEDGLSVQVYAVCRADDLVVGDDTTIGSPEEFDEDLIAGAIATGLAREAMRPDLAVPFRQQHEGACTELLKQTRRRYRGPGPTQIRVEGYNSTAR